MIKQTIVVTPKGLKIPTYHLSTLIVGAGAAGMNCSVHLHEFMSRSGVEAPENLIAVVTSNASGGASRMSGSDKQTYYKLGTSPAFADSARDFAETLIAHGCMDGDVALAEAQCSLQEFFHLVQIGVPFPHDPEGAYIGYKTDHDPRERATSAGPKTSLYMCQCLDRQAQKMGITSFDAHEAVRFLVSGNEDSRRIIGLLTLDKRRSHEDSLGLTLFLCNNLVLAAGGPGDLYKTSVYPHGQGGIHGLALEAGLKARNLTESQFGLASIKFRWNVSGTYMQVVPRVFSTDAEGAGEREFLARYFDSTAKMATNIFLKGYQWPFDPQRVTNQQSSLIDVLVHTETEVLGRRVFLDFRSNPVPGEGKEPFCLEDLDEEAYNYLARNGALQQTPIERLEHMNPLAIDIYLEHGIDIRKEPLEIKVCAQHHNGGLAVNKWWESNVPHTFVIGEMAGTHGVKRPGGSALNSGQVGGLRAAEYIVNVYGTQPCEVSLDEPLLSQVESDHIWLASSLCNSGGIHWRDFRDKVQTTMSSAAGHIRSLDACRCAKDSLLELYNHIQTKGFRADDAADLAMVARNRHLLVAALAFVESIEEYLTAGGGSRGSYVVVGSGGETVHPELLDPVNGEPLQILPENVQLRKTVSELAPTTSKPPGFSIRRVPVNAVPDRDEPFEAAWRAFRNGEVFHK